MSAERRPGRASGRTTGVHGTAFAVDLTADRRARDIWVVLLGGPLIWISHFMVVYLVAEAGCTGDGPGLEVFDPPVPTVLTLAATAVAAVACLGFAVWGYRRWAVGRSDREHLGDDSGRRPLAFIGFLLSVGSLVSVLLVGLPAPFVATC